MKTHQLLYTLAGAIALWLGVSITQWRMQTKRAAAARLQRAEAERDVAQWEKLQALSKARARAEALALTERLHIGLAAWQTPDGRDSCLRALRQYAGAQVSEDARLHLPISQRIAALQADSFEYSDNWRARCAQTYEQTRIGMEQLRDD